MSPVKGHRTVEMLIFAGCLALLLGTHARMGLSLDQDDWSTLLWSRELVRGEALDRASFTAPKLLPILIAAAGQWVPGARGPEWFYAAVTAVAGAGVVLAASRLARRLGGALSGWVAVALVLGHMQFIRYVVNGQSVIYASLFLLSALLLATRQEIRVRDYLWAAALVFGAALCRPETFAAGAGLGLALYVRLGWRRPGWPLVVGLIPLASVGVNLLFYQVAFGSASYTSDLAMTDTVLRGTAVSGLAFGFAARVAKAIFHYANESWELVFLAAVGVGVVLRSRRDFRYGALLFCPLATGTVMWVLTARGQVFNERCLYYVSLVILSLAAGGLGRMAEWACASGEFLPGLKPRGRAAGFAALALAFLAPQYLTRPVPRQGLHNAKLESAFAFLRGQIRDCEAPPRILVPDDLSQMFYRLDLPADRCCVSALYLIRAGDGRLPDDVRWAVMDEGSKAVEFPPDWGLREAWRDPTGKVRVYRRVMPDAASKRGSPLGNSGGDRDAPRLRLPGRSAGG